ncbi:MAG: BlaI/MecI/CopY family transcriptional regulator [Bryobacteraceae bacterium]
MKAPPRPTQAELEILSILWQNGPATVRRVHAAMSPSRRTGYTTVLKLMQIMADKGLVDRDQTERAHVYRPRLKQEETQRRLLDDLLDRAFGGSAAQLVMQALSRKPASREELRAIRELLDRHERGVK